MKRSIFLTPNTKKLNCTLFLDFVKNSSVNARLNRHLLSLTPKLLILCSLFSLSGCYYLDQVSFLEVETTGYDEVKLLSTTNQTDLFGLLFGIVTPDEVENYGHLWSLGDTEPSLENNIGQTSFGISGNDIIISTLTDLTPGKSYNYRAYAIFNNQVIYGEVDRFTVGTPAYELIARNTSGYEIIQTGPQVVITTDINNTPEGLIIKEVGGIWGQNNPPTLENGNLATVGSINTDETESYTVTLNGLERGVCYFFRPYMRLGETTIFGNQISFRIDDLWTKKTGFDNFKALGPYAFSSDGLGHILSGFNLQASPFHFTYDPQTDLWDYTAFQQVPSNAVNQFGVTLVIDEKVYMGIGTANKNLWEYDVKTDVWTEVDAFPGELIQRPWFFTANGKGYIGSGKIGNDPYDTAISNKVWEFDPSMAENNQWKEIATLDNDNLPAPRYSAKTFTLGDTVYLGPGPKSIWESVDDFWKYNTKNHTWHKMDQPSSSLSGCLQIGNYSTFTIDGKGYMGLGSCHNIWEYNPLTGQWLERARTAQGLSFAATFVINGRAYALDGGGDGSIPEMTFWEYIPEASCE